MPLGIGVSAIAADLPLLTEIRDASPDKIAIVGMNLDPADAPTQAFCAKPTGLPELSKYFISDREGCERGRDSNFGMVSMPFVAVLDQQGRVAALDFKGQKLRQIVDELLSP